MSYDGPYNKYKCAKCGEKFSTEEAVRTHPCQGMKKKGSSSITSVLRERSSVASIFGLPVSSSKVTEEQTGVLKTSYFKTERDAKEFIKQSKKNGIKVYKKEKLLSVNSRGEQYLVIWAWSIPRNRKEMQNGIVWPKE